MSCPCPLVFPDAFNPEKRPMTVAALLSADVRERIEPADGQRWFSRDLNELKGRGWAHVDQMRADRMFYYRLTDAGREQAAALTASGWTFDGYDPWLGDTLVRP